MENHINRKHKCNCKLSDIDEITIDTCIYYGFKCDCDTFFDSYDECELHKKECKDCIILDLKNKLQDKGDVNITNNTNNNNTNNIQINIVLNSYKDTDVSKLTDKHYINAINKMFMSIPTLIKHVHFNPNIPENQNIYISNMRNGHVMVYNSDTKNWDARPKEEMINRIIYDREYDIQEWLDCDKYPNAKQKFEEYLEKKESDEVQQMIKEEVELALYNNRNVIKTK